MKVKEILDEGIIGRVKQMADDMVERASWTPRFIQQMIMKYGHDVVTRYIVTKVPEKQKERIARTIEKWLRKHKGDTLARNMKSILYSINGTV